MQFRQNMMTFATLLGNLRKGAVTTLMSVYEIKFQVQEKQAEGDACARMVENVTRVSC